MCRKENNDTNISDILMIVKDELPLRESIGSKRIQIKDFLTHRIYSLRP